MTDKHVYRCLPYKVSDGDSFWAMTILYDYGFRDYKIKPLNFRLKEIDTWETRNYGRHKFSEEHLRRGQLAQVRATELLMNNWIWIESFKDPEKYGRWLCLINFGKKKPMPPLFCQMAKILKQEGHEKQEGI